MKLAVAFLLLLTMAVPAVAAETESPARGARCVKVELLNLDNMPVAGQPAVVGLLVGGKPILAEENYPRYTGMRLGLPAPCPAALVESVAQNYKASCLTAERRMTTSAANNATAASVATQCQAIREALGDSLTAYLK